MKLEIHPLTPDRWHDLEALFGAKGACSGCWCMWYRKSAKQFAVDKYETNRQDFHQLVTRSGTPPGLLGYMGDQPVAWVAVAPRREYPRLANSRVLKPVDDTPVWSITCLFVEKQHRNMGLSAQMVDAAAQFALHQGAPAVEGYPHDLKQGDRQADAFVWTGLLGGFLKAGFEEVERRSPKRPIVRRVRKDTLDG
ncbi:GNAT family N-acetyltransferase [bacterium]|nr:GNAT family N-acetyltransferase [bacterium]